MREKLAHTQKILEAVVTSDWSSLETHSRELERLTNDPRWMVLKYPEYAQHSAAFVRAVQALHSAAAPRDLEETPKAYINVTRQCVVCIDISPARGLQMTDDTQSAPTLVRG